MRLALIFLVPLIALAGCAGNLRNPYSYKSRCPAELMERFVDGDPIDKMGAAQLMADNDCTEGVPVILDDLRAVASAYHCEPAGPPTDQVVTDSVSSKCFVTWRGRKVPYVDYHAPLFGALTRLTGVPYFEPDAAWYAALDRWVDAHLGKHE